VLTGLERAGHLKQLINQNHDGLSLKAGFDLRKLNEIHGSWFDQRNPVVTMDGSMREDLIDRLEDWTERADCVLSLGTSLSGLYADMVCSAAAERASASRSGLGLVIVSLTKTPLDDQATLRIFAPIDDVLQRLAGQLQLNPGHLPTDAEVKAASKRSQLFRTYAMWYRDVLDCDKRYRRESKRQIRRRAQP
jgi:NAD-dependent SIR2 family protein deacetylase